MDLSERIWQLYAEADAQGDVYVRRLISGAVGILFPRRRNNAKSRRFREANRSKLAANARTYWAEHKDEIKLKKALYRDVNRDRIREQNRQYQQSHPEHRGGKATKAERDRRYHAAHINEVNARRRARYQERAAEMRARSAAYHREHPEKARERGRRFRERQSEGA